ncbi:4-hydroxybenzoate synthetase [Halochromatium glycolicum]|uniref:4-hydroxybenzoate synthetase n=1 Tax=Halochromatium glycolicum TaxID=85075 RepID=A0AAJ0U625_9GAMM|nr:4-hydroxybenzoate synthetase [Halochromatium glycolicum]
MLTFRLSNGPPCRIPARAISGRRSDLVDRYYRRPLPDSGPNPFQCQGFVRNGTIANAGGEPLPIETLPPFLRALLVTDGTVTKALEAYFWEPVVVDTLRQEFIVAADEIPWIAVKPQDQVLVREALLRGSDTGKHYAQAFSVIRTALIPSSFRERLINREIGIGVLIRDSGLESFREVMEVGVEPEPIEGARALYRTYRIIIDGRPVILISETFPLELYL